MSVITFVNVDKKEIAQTMSVAALASCMEIEHTYKSLIMSTDYNDKTMENCFFNENKKSLAHSLISQMGRTNIDVSSGLEGLVRMFASNTASSDAIKSYTRPILNDRLDLLEGPKTTDIKDYQQISTYFSNIAEYANKVYDLIFVDLNKNIPKENQEKIFGISSLIVVGLSQTQQSINNFSLLKQRNPLFTRSNVAILIGRYNPESRYTAKNIARLLNEKNIPLIVPYNITFTDNCCTGTIIDYMLSVQNLSFKNGKDGYFYEEVKKSIETLDFLRQKIDYGIK